MIRTDTPSTVIVVVVCVEEELDEVDDDDDIDDSDDNFDFFLEEANSVRVSKAVVWLFAYFLFCDRFFRLRSLIVALSF